MLSDHLYYYEDKAAYDSKQDPLGRVVLNAFFCSKSETDASEFEFVVHAYPKSLALRATSAADLDDWVNTIMMPLQELAREPLDDDGVIRA